MSKRIKLFLCFLLFPLILLINFIKWDYKEVIQLQSSPATWDTSATRKVCRVIKTKVGFLKTHKCASTSIQNILMRFGMKNNLNFVMPKSGDHLGYNFYYNRSMIIDTPWEKAGLNYSIFMIHTKWNHEEISKTLKDQGDVIYISMIRDPIELVISFLDYNVRSCLCLLGYNLSRRALLICMHSPYFDPGGSTIHYY